MFNLYGATSTCILADDLTGACDAAAAFAGRGICTEVRLRPGFDAVSSAVMAVSTATRDVPPPDAVAALEALARNPNISAIPNLFKKIDSVFRGNTFVEIAVSARLFHHRFTVIAPASPHHGRTCLDDLLHVRDVTGHRVMALRPALNGAGLHPVWLAAGNDAHRLESQMRIALADRIPAVFCNAASDDHLDAIVRAARALAHPILWIGSSGLAHALAASLHSADLQPAPAPPPGNLLLFTGSNHPVTARQLAHLRDCTVPVKVIQIDRNRTTNDQIHTAIHAVSPATVGALVLNGGDTALQVCRALQIHTFRLAGEFAPGIPLGLASGGAFDGCTVILKSGGFGAVDLLTRIAGHCSQEQPV